jgi:hypothetical protein
MGSVMGLEASVLGLEGELALAREQEANSDIVGQQGIDLDRSHKSIHIRPSSHNSRSRTHQVHDH